MQIAQVKYRWSISSKEEIDVMLEQAEYILQTNDPEDGDEIDLIEIVCEELACRGMSYRLSSSQKSKLLNILVDAGDVAIRPVLRAYHSCPVMEQEDFCRSFIDRYARKLAMELAEKKSRSKFRASLTSFKKWLDW